MSRWMFLVVLLLGLGLPAINGHGQEPRKVDILMKKKLVHAQKVLEGVSTQNFKMIETNAEELIEISKAAEWTVMKTPQYEIYSNDFRRSAQSLAENARKKNIDGAALNYVELTLTCVKCHKHVRETRMTRLD